MENLYKFYCIEEVGQWILENKFKQVGLEFAEDTENCVAVSKALKDKIGFTPYILHDPNRVCGNCCVDVRTSRPRGIECIVHFGSSCLTPTGSFPVQFVLSSPIQLDSSKILEALLSENGPKKEDYVILTYDILCLPSISALYTKLREHFPNLVYSSFVVSESAKLIFYSSDLSDDLSTKLKLESENEKEVIFNNRKAFLPNERKLEDYNFIYIGSNRPSLISLQMKFSDKCFYVVSPSGEMSVSNFVKSVMNRSAKIEQVRAAKTIGIINSLPHGHSEICLRLRNLVKTSNRRCYSFFIGKINEAKLGNIVGVDVFVYVGCPESSLFDRNDDKYLYKNIVTPWEVEVALNPSIEWSLNFELDFRSLTKDDKFNGDFTPIDKNHLPNLDLEPSESRLNVDSSSVCIRNSGTLATLHENAAGQALAGLSWKGLDPNEESSVPIGTVVKGRKGIAIEYEEEGQ